MRGLRLAEVDRLDLRSLAISSGVPSVSTAPLTSTVMRVAKLKTRSMSCSISSTATSAWAARPRWPGCRHARPAGTPAAGSSSSSTRGAGHGECDLEQAALAVGQFAASAGRHALAGGTAPAALRIRRRWRRRCPSAATSGAPRPTRLDTASARLCSGVSAAKELVDLEGAHEAEADALVRRQRGDVAPEQLDPGPRSAWRARR
jgi:hypothetical protein